MPGKKHLKLCVDIGLYAVLLALLSYPVTRGLFRHGVLGMTFLGLLLLHQTLNLAWYKSFFKGKQTYRRLVQSTANILLVAAASALVASSLAMAGEVFALAPFAMPWWGRSLHTFASAWCFVLASFHLGLHGGALWSSLKRLLGVLHLPALSLAALAGLHFFLESGLLLDMLILGEVRFRPPNLQYFLVQYLFITALFCILARLVLSLGAMGRRKEGGREGAGGGTRVGTRKGTREGAARKGAGESSAGRRGQMAYQKAVSDRAPNAQMPGSIPNDESAVPARCGCAESRRECLECCSCMEGRSGRPSWTRLRLN